ncbi:MAG: GTP cyclohydrolase II [Alphaproteobacteria bacterium]|nr:GTP cyclohydrolase II [Alphaproteobacteria bacterium]
MDKFIDNSVNLDGLNPTEQGELALASEWLQRNLPLRVGDGRGHTVLFMLLDGATPEQIRQFQAKGAGALILGIGGLRAQSLGLLAETDHANNSPFMVEIALDALDLPNFASEIQANYPAPELLNGLDLASQKGGRKPVAPTHSEMAQIALNLIDMTDKMPQFLLVRAQNDPNIFSANSGLDARGIWQISTRLAEFLSTAKPNAMLPILHKIDAVTVPLLNSDQTKIVGWRDARTHGEHLALMIGNFNPKKSVLTRIHSSCLTGDALGSRRCDCGEQLQGAISLMAENPDGGLILYLSQEGRGIGLINKLRAYQLQTDGMDTIDANHRLGFAADRRDYRIAALMLQQMGLNQIRLLSNNPLKLSRLAAAAAEIGSSLSIAERVSHKFPANPHNQSYLATKKIRAGHDL